MKHTTIAKLAAVAAVAPLLAMASIASAQTYDASGTPINVYDANGNLMTTVSSGAQAYDASGDPINVYDANGNLISGTTGTTVTTGTTGVPNTGAGANMALNYSLMALSGIALVGGAYYIQRAARQA